MPDNILIVRNSVYHANLPQPLFNKEGRFYDSLYQRAKLLQGVFKLPAITKNIFDN